jgi:hypothetical protein
MKHSHEPSTRAKTSTRAPLDAPPATQGAAAESAARPLRWGDPAHARDWLTAARDAFDDLAAAAREGSRRRKDRVLSRAEVRRQGRDAESRLTALFEAAEAGLLAEKGDRGA